MRSFEYVGPDAIRRDAAFASKGAPITSRAALAEWLTRHGREDEGWATYVVSLEGALLLAPRRSEHVACAGGEPVLAAGEIRFDVRGAVLELTNNSTGYCPAEDCLDAVRGALHAAGLEPPDAWTFTAVFRRCPECGARNLVKDAWYTCAVCTSALPAAWNFEGRREE